MVESEVRRSPRLKTSSKGFKSKGCSDKKCLACVTKPPILKKSIIQKIAIDFCKLDESEVGDDLLQMKRVKTHPIARARIAPAAPAPSQTEQGRNELDAEGEDRAVEEEE